MKNSKKKGKKKCRQTVFQCWPQEGEREKASIITKHSIMSVQLARKESPRALKRSSAFVLAGVRIRKRSRGSFWGTAWLRWHSDPDGDTLCCYGNISLPSIAVFGSREQSSKKEQNMKVGLWLSGWEAVRLNKFREIMNYFIVKITKLCLL